MSIMNEFNYMLPFLENPESFSQLKHKTSFLAAIGHSKCKMDTFTNFFMDSMVSHKYLPDVPLYTRAVCSHCGKTLLIYFNGERFIEGEYSIKRFLTTHKVPILDCIEIQDYDFEINIPTGEIVISDGLHLPTDIKQTIYEIGRAHV